MSMESSSARAAHSMGRVHVDDVAGHEPVEQHADGGQVLLDRWSGEMALQILHEGGDVEGLYVGKLVQAMQLAPLGKAARRIQVGFPGVVVVDLRGEEFEHALRRLRRRREQRGGARGEDNVGAGTHGLSVNRLVGPSFN